MGYPILTRLGLNQFWYKYWYTDTCYHLFLKQDHTFEILLNWYFNYGLLSTNFRLNKYFFNKKLNLNNSVINNYRRYFYVNLTLSIDHNYRIRIKTDEYFPMRLWIFRYSGWIIFSIKWYKPLKKKNNNLTSIYKGSLIKKKYFNISKRFKLLYYYIYYLYLKTSFKHYLF